ncbi:MAG TPA: MarR family transcriptional regulator [Solirubrobacteraceae bacterium]|nr:MarR family transcriptional regulator [Solirubrobacteraceae bacterium]
MESAGASDFLAGFDALAQAVRRARGANGRGRVVIDRAGVANGGAPGVNGNGKDGGLTLSQYGLLELLADRQSARVQELAAHAGITPSTATRILDALQRRGVVERTRSDEDRRAVAVSLTEDGRQLVNAEQEWLRGRQRTFYAALPGAEQELAPDLLFRLAALIDELAAGPDHEP